MIVGGGWGTIHRPQPGGVPRIALLPGAARASGQIPGYYFPENEPFWETGVWELLGGILPERIEYLWDIVTETLSPPEPVVISEIPQTWEALEELDPELFEPILETRPGRTPDPYPQTVALPPPEQLPAEPDEEEPMAHDWGHLIRQGIGELTGIGQAAPQALVGPGAQTPAATEAWLTGTTAVSTGGDCDGMAWSGGTPPKGYKVVNYCGKGVLRKVRRRRKPRMLTRSDSQDVATIIGLVGKGQLASVLMNRR